MPRLFATSDPRKGSLVVSTNDSGVALLLVIFVVMLASIIVINLAHSTYLSSRLNITAERSLQAEYLLKSAINFSRILIKEDKTPEDGPQDLWGKFANGAAIPAAILGLTEPGLVVSLEIRPEDSKLPITGLQGVGSSMSGTGTPNPTIKWPIIFQLLFEHLGFDNDTDETDQTGLVPGKHFNSGELVANLIDYIDPGTESFDGAAAGYNKIPRGIEADLPKDYFPNSQMTSILELQRIPGFTPTRVRKLIPFITTFGTGQQVNINLAPSQVLQAVIPNCTETEAEKMRTYAASEEGPFKATNKLAEIQRVTGLTDQDNRIAILTRTESTFFQVIAKVDYGSSTYFARAYLRKQGTGAGGGSADLPEIAQLELF